MENCHRWILLIFLNSKFITVDSILCYYICATRGTAHTLKSVFGFYSPRFTTDYYINYMYLLKKKNYLALLVDITFLFFNNNDSNFLFGKKNQKVKRRRQSLNI